MKRRIKCSMLFATLLFICCGADGFRVEVNLPTASELKKGSQVRYRSVPVGEVEKVVLRRAQDGKATEAIAMLVIRDPQVVIRESDTFSLGTAGLIGDSYVDISPGPSGSPPLRPGSTVAGVVPRTFPIPDIENLSTASRLLELTSRLSKLPPERRDAIMKELHAIVDKALKE